MIVISTKVMRRLSLLLQVFLAILPALFVCPAVAQSAQAGTQPLPEAKILSFLKDGGITNRRMATLVSERGVNFSLTPEIEKELRGAGADNALIAAIRKAEPRTERVAGTTAGTTKVNSKDGLTYVWIPPGNFMMGCSPGDNCLAPENPPHRVTITKGFWMGQTLVTQAAYQRTMNANPSYYTASRVQIAATGRDWNPSDVHVDRLPVEQVNWDEATAYCALAGMRLPTEAEWEYAARAGSKASRYGDLNAVAWWNDNSGSVPHEVGQKQPNAWKLYDMLGNMEEWTSDWYDDNYYSHSASRDPHGPSSGQERVVRGGSWLSFAWFVRLSYRYGAKPDKRGYIGFRCVRESVP